MTRSVRGVRAGITVTAVLSAAIGTAIGHETAADGNTSAKSKETDKQALTTEENRQAPTTGPDKQAPTREPQAPTAGTETQVPATSADKQQPTAVSLSRRLTLRDGSVIVGTLVELSPNVSVTLLLPSGEVRTTRWVDIDEMEYTKETDATRQKIVPLPVVRPTRPATGTVGKVLQHSEPDDASDPYKRVKASTVRFAANLGVGFLYSRMLSTSFYLGAIDLRLGFLIRSKVELTFGPRLGVGRTASGNSVLMINPLAFSVGSRWMSRYYYGLSLLFMDLILVQGPKKDFTWASIALALDLRVRLIERERGALMLFVQPGLSAVQIETFNTSGESGTWTMAPRFLLNLGLGYSY